MGDQSGAWFLRPDALPDANKMFNPGMWLGASVAFAFNSLAQGPVKPMGFAATSAKLESRMLGFSARHHNHSAISARPALAVN